MNAVRPGILAAALWIVLLGATPPVPTRSDVPAARDTTRVDSVAAGDVLTVLLPSELDGVSVTRYEALRVPATGWFTGRSFFWRTEAAHRGRHRFAFLAQRNDGRRDSVFVLVVVGDARR